MALKTVPILGVPFAKVKRAELVGLLHKHIKNDEKAFVVTANPEIVMKAKDDPDYMKVVQQAQYITADGIGVVKAAKLLGNELPERVAGYDTMIDLLKLADQHHLSIYLLGAAEDVLNKAIENIKQEYPGVTIAGSHHGFFDWEKNSIADEVAALKPDLVFVALGLPRQENWIAKHLDQFEKGVFMGVGGSIDVIAGAVERAPEFWQKANLEWLYRLLKQPARWRRMLVLPQFALIILGQKAKGKR